MVDEDLKRVVTYKQPVPIICIYAGDRDWRQTLPPVCIRSKISEASRSRRNAAPETVKARYVKFR